MDYKLAKQLKDAGFPQETLWYWIEENGKWSLETEDHWNTVDGEWGMCRDIKDMQHVSSPTLPELIEACGEKFEELVRFDSNVWQANPCGGNYQDLVCRGEKLTFATPEEAVSFLWLKINKK